MACGCNKSIDDSCLVCTWGLRTTGSNIQCTRYEQPGAPESPVMLRGTAVEIENSDRYWTRDTYLCTLFERREGQ